jgi:hypothetical protein
MTSYLGFTHTPNASGVWEETKTEFSHSNAAVQWAKDNSAYFRELAILKVMPDGSTITLYENFTKSLKTRAA